MTNTADTSTVTVRCRLVGELRQYLQSDSRGEGSVQLQSPATVAGLLEQLGLPERHLLIAGLNGEKVPHTATLNDGDELTIVAPMEGG